MARLNKLLTGHQITDEVINRTSAASLPLGHDTILQTGVVVRTAAGGGGTLLTLTTDYTLGSADSRLTTEAGQNVYTKLAIVNGAYQSTNLYVTYKTVGDYGSVETIYAVASEIVDLVYPVGCYYTQYPNASSNTEATEFPVAYRPATLFGGTWVEQWPTESVYFRTRGTLSDTGRTNGKQEDAFQGHDWYTYEAITNSATTLLSQPERTPATNNGVANDSAYSTTTNSSNPANSGKTNGGITTDGTNGTPRTAAETRTVNRRIKVWKRTA